MNGLEGARDLCALIGGLLLDGASQALLGELAATGRAADLAARVGGALAAPLGAMQEALRQEGIHAVAAEYTRLTVADGTAGPRRPVPVPLWADVQLGNTRQVLGPRSRAALESYLAAGLGFHGMREVPADHVGLELLFLAALLDQELRGERDAAARTAFLGEHLKPLAEAVGGSFQVEARDAFWRALGAALSLVPVAAAPDDAGGGRALN